MKNECCVNNINNCSYCNQKGFFCDTPLGGDYITCPCCGNFDFLSSYINNENSTKYDFLFEPEFDNDMRCTYTYCDDCNIIFQIGCEHCNRGCTDNVYNCHFIKKWKHKITNIEYDGMPKFDNVDDWFNNVNNVDVLQMYCPHKNNKCKKTCYEINDICNL